MKKLVIMLFRLTLLALAACTVLLLSCQSKLIYYPRPYEAATLQHVQRQGGVAITVETSQGQQTAHYLPPEDNPTAPPSFVWFVFGGNGARALDYREETQQWDKRFGFVYVDYPGYGSCRGKASPAHISETLEKVAAAVQTRFHWSDAEFQRRAGVLGHSLGCAAALMLAESSQLKAVVICAPFTTMTEMARGVVGWPLCYVNMHRFNNVARLEKLPADAKVRVFHGTIDEVIPVRMGRDLATRFPGIIQYTEIPEARHNDIVTLANRQIGQALLEVSGQ